MTPKQGNSGNDMVTNDRIKHRPPAGQLSVTLGHNPMIQNGLALDAMQVMSAGACHRRYGLRL